MKGARIVRSGFSQGALTTVVMLVVGAQSITASTIFYEEDIFGSPPDERAAPWTQTVSLPRFNQTAPVGYEYVLNSVVVYLGWDTSGEIKVQNTDAGASLAFTDATSSVPLTVTGPDDLTVNATAQAGPLNSATSTPSYSTSSPPPPTYGEPVPEALSITNFLNYCTLQHPCIVNGENDYTGLTGSGVSNSSPAGLAPYEGFGNVDLTFTVTAGGGTYGGSEVGGAGHLFFSGSADVGGYVKIVYNYQEEAQIPEPGTLFMVGSALAGASLILQRKRKRARS